MGRLEELEKKLDERLGSLDRRLEGRLGGQPPRGAAVQPGRRGMLAARTEGVPAAQLFADYATPGEAETVQLFEFVRNSAHVQGNALYAGILGATRFVFAPEDNTLNAYATLAGGQDGETVPAVFLLGGAARFGRVASLAVAATRGGDASAGERFLALVKRDGLGEIGMDWSVRAVLEAGLTSALADDKTLVLAKSVSAGLFLGILAHEAGHLALGHLYRLEGGETNNDISRNQEREADSFASSIIAASPFGEYILAGTLFWHYALAQLEEGGRATTHPLSKERFGNFVRANPDLAEEFGLAAEA